MRRILMLYSTTDGHTLKICERLKQVVDATGCQATLAPVGNFRTLDLPSFDKIVVGASIRYGRHNRQIFDFITEHLHLLERTPNAFFSVNIVARKAAKNRPETNPYVQKFLRHTPWRPRQLAVFAGKLDYPRYGFADRLMIRLIMWMTDGPTDPSTVVEFTDWTQVEAFALELCEN